ncbi:unnamed protein product [Rhizopus microsporus]|uniref:YTH domain-containing protein n=2 Tax=Rhizopus TaxID=4842 RepID=A0A1X0RQH3_RHIZD|nr:hypothetical protein BCV71DRAFT_293732 [Rhizopus microsporus]
MPKENHSNQCFMSVETNDDCNENTNHLFQYTSTNNVVALDDEYNSEENDSERKRSYIDDSGMFHCDEDLKEEEYQQESNSKEELYQKGLDLPPLKSFLKSAIESKNTLSQDKNDASIYTQLMSSLDMTTRKLHNEYSISCFEDHRSEHKLSSSAPSGYDYLDEYRELQMLEMQKYFQLSASAPASQMANEDIIDEEHEPISDMNDFCNNELVVTANESQTCSITMQGQQTVQSDENEYDYQETTAAKDDNRELVDDHNLSWKELADKCYGQTEDKLSLSTVDPNNPFLEVYFERMRQREYPFSSGGPPYIYINPYYMPYQSCYTAMSTDYTPMEQPRNHESFIMEVTNIAGAVKLKHLYELFFDPNVLYHRDDYTAFVCYQSLDSLTAAVGQYYGRRFMGKKLHCCAHMRENFTTWTSLGTQTTECTMEPSSSTSSYVGNRSDAEKKNSKAHDGKQKKHFSFTIHDEKSPTTKQERTQNKPESKRENRRSDKKKLASINADCFWRPLRSSEYILATSNTTEDLIFAKATGYWSVDDFHVDFINTLFTSCKNVYLIFIPQQADYISGFGKITSKAQPIHSMNLKNTPFAIKKSEFQIVKEGRNWRNILKIRWINKSKLPLATVGDLETKISESQKVSIKACPDITALDNLVGKTIVKAFSE